MLNFGNHAQVEIGSMSKTDTDILLNQLQAATSGHRDKFAAIVAAVGYEDLPPLQWAEEIRFETHLSASGLPRKVVALEALESSPAGDADLDAYNARVNRTCPLNHYPEI